MQEVVIKYNNPQTLKLLKDLSKYFDFVISKPKYAKNDSIVSKHPAIIPGDHSIDISELHEIFSEENIDAKELRNKTWQRRK
jgi:hypothetical protein